MECFILDDMYLYLLPKKHLDYIATMNKYGIAYGEQGGKFKAAYFSLNGSAKAIISAKSMLPSIIDDKEKNSDYKDTYL